MRQRGRVLGFLLFLINIASVARADLITINFSNATVIDFSQFATPGQRFTLSPVQIGDVVGLDVLFTANPLDGGNNGLGAVLASGTYGLAGNGSWDGEKTHSGYTGLDATTGGMTYAFNFGRVSMVGGFVNYVPELGGVTLEALDAAGNILETHLLDVEAPISTPGGLNEGAFRGIRRSRADIAAFRVSNGFVVLDDLAFSASPAPIPEPSTLLLFSSGAVGLAVRAWRRGRTRPRG